MHNVGIYIANGVCFAFMSLGMYKFLRCILIDTQYQVKLSKGLILDVKNKLEHIISLNSKNKEVVDENKEVVDEIFNVNGGVSNVSEVVNDSDQKRFMEYSLTHLIKNGKKDESKRIYELWNELFPDDNLD